MITCVFENGARASLRHVTVGAIAYKKDNKILLVKRAPHLTRGGKYTIPGGFLDRDEDAKQAVLRELKEETGYNGLHPQLFKINDNPKRRKEDRQNVDFIYLVEVTSGNKKENPEVTEIDWFDINHLPKEVDFAFDHRDSILEYFKHLKQPLKLPIIG